MWKQETLVGIPWSEVTAEEKDKLLAPMFTSEGIHELYMIMGYKKSDRMMTSLTLTFFGNTDFQAHTDVLQRKKKNRNRIGLKRCSFTREPLKSAKFITPVNRNKFWQANENSTFQIAKHVIKYDVFLTTKDMAPSRIAGIIWCQPNWIFKLEGK